MVGNTNVNFRFNEIYKLLDNFLILDKQTELINKDMITTTGIYGIFCYFVGILVGRYLLPKKNK